MYYRNRETQKRLKRLHRKTASHYGAGSYYDERAGRYKRYTCQNKYWKKVSKRKIRRALNKSSNFSDGSAYKRLYDYWWQVA